MVCLLASDRAAYINRPEHRHQRRLLHAVKDTEQSEVWHTRLTALFGMRLPILGGGLMWLSDADHVAALVRAGCMAFITPRSFDSLSAFEQQLQRCREACGAAPFGVNLTLSRRMDFEADVVHPAGSRPGARRAALRNPSAPCRGRCSTASMRLAACWCTSARRSSTR